MPIITPPSKIERVRVLVIESPSALDCFENRTESQTLQAVCKLFGHEFASTLVRSETEFRTALAHATSINPGLIPVGERRRPLCLHIACHGGDAGLALGADSLSWEELASCLWDFFQGMNHYEGPLILVISACCVSGRKITNVFQTKAKARPKSKIPAYVITTVGDDKGLVDWADSVLAWSIFYHQVGKAILSRSDIQLILDKIQLVGAERLKYFRWDSYKKMYYHYVSTAKEHARQVGSFKVTNSSSRPTPKPRRSSA